MKKSFLRLPGALIVLSLLCACGAQSDVPESTAPVTAETDLPESTAAPAETPAPVTEEVTTAAPEPKTFSLKDGFRVVNSTLAGTSNGLSSVKTALLTQLNSRKAVFSCTAVTDTVNDGSDGMPEVVIGNSNRPESAEIYRVIGPLDWQVTVKNNRVLLIGGSPDATAKAVNWFIMNCVLKDVTEYTEGVLQSFVSDEKMPEIPALPPYTNENLRGLTLYCIGDSYFAGEGLNPKTEVWPALLAKKYGMTFENYGKGGSTVSDCITTNTPMCRRVSEMKAGNPDIVLFEGGANDWNHNIPLGEAGSKDTKTFRGAVASCIEQLHEKYPNALIVCISNWEYGKANSQKVQTTEYAKAMTETAKNYPYTLTIDASDTSVIPAHVTSSVFRAKYCIAATDLNHLNAEGMQMIEPFFEKIIGEGWNSFKK